MPTGHPCLFSFVSSFHFAAPRFPLFVFGVFLVFLVSPSLFVSLPCSSWWWILFFLSRCYTAPALLRACKPAYSPCVLSSSLSYVLLLIYFIFFFSVFFRLLIGRLFMLFVLFLLVLLLFPRFRFMLCVCSSHQTGLSSRRHRAHLVSVCGFFLLERYKLWSQNHDTRHTTM